MGRRLIDDEIDKAMGLPADASDLGRVLVWWRNACGITQRELEPALPLARSRILDLEHGRVRVNEDHLALYSRLDASDVLPWLENTLRAYKAARRRTEREIRKTFGRAKSS